MADSWIDIEDIKSRSQSDLDLRPNTSNNDELTLKCSVCGWYWRHNWCWHICGECAVLGKESPEHQARMARAEAWMLGQRAKEKLRDQIRLPNTD